jgi:hypothetical protein
MSQRSLKQAPSSRQRAGGSEQQAASSSHLALKPSAPHRFTFFLFRDVCECRNKDITHRKRHTACMSFEREGALGSHSKSFEREPPPLLRFSTSIAPLFNKYSTKQFATQSSKALLPRERPLNLPLLLFNKYTTAFQQI